MTRLNGNVVSVALVFSFICLFADASELFRKEPGALWLNSTQLRINHACSSPWSVAECSPETLKNGVLSTAKGALEFHEEWTELSETEGEWTISFKAQSPDGVPTADVGAWLSMPLLDYFKTPAVVNKRWIEFPKRFVEKNWQRSYKVPEVVIQDFRGRWYISGISGLMLQDNRRFSSSNVECRLRLPVTDGKITDLTATLHFRFQPYEATALRLDDAANMALRDEVADDRKGGWTDQGPQNDLRAMKPGKIIAGGIPFEISDTDVAVIALRGKGRPYFPDRSTLQLKSYSKYRFLYLLHAVAWEDAEAAATGTVTVVYKNGESDNFPIISGKNVGNWWGPNALEDAVVGWSARNDSARIGLYVTGFPLKSLPVQRIEFASANNAVWLIAGVTMSNAPLQLTPLDNTPLVMKPGKDWRVGHNKNIAAGTILDLSRTLDAPAGKYGFVKCLGEDFVFANAPRKRVKFYGPNLCEGACFPDKENAVNIANDLARRGYNVVRLHHFDGFCVQSADSPQLNAEKMARLDFLLSELRKRGIYVTIDLYISRAVSAKSMNLPGDYTYQGNTFKMLFFLEESARENLKTYTRNLLEHVNPYTGLALKDDPQLITISMINEDSISLLVDNKYIQSHPYLKPRLRDEYVSWQKSNGQADDGNLYNRAFISELYQEKMSEFYRWLKANGVKCPVTSSNHGNDYMTTALRRNFDFVDNHFYWGHPQWIGKDWNGRIFRMEASSILSEVGDTLGKVAGSRRLDAPVTITEWSFCAPNSYRVEGSLVFPAFAALQGFDMLNLFQYTSGKRQVSRIAETESPITLFDTLHEPILTLRELAGVMLFRQENISEAKLSFPWQQPKGTGQNPQFTPTEYRRLALIGKIGTIDAEDARKTPLYFSFDGGAGRPAEEGLAQKLQSENYIPVGSVDATGAQYKSATSELTFDIDAGTFSAVVPRCEAFVLPQSKALRGEFMQVQNKNAFAAVFAAAMDDKPLSKSSRILLMHLADVKNSDQRFRDATMQVVEAGGTTPLLFRRAECQVTFLRPLDGFKLYALDFDGTRLKELPLQETMTLDNYAIADKVIAAYELVRE